MGEIILDTIAQFKEQGGISLLLELDNLPHEEFDSHPIYVQIRQKAYMWCHSTHSDGFTCFQHAMAYILDKFHPGIVAYIAQEFPRDLCNEDDHFTKLLNNILSEIDKHKFGYFDLVGRDSFNRETDKDQMFTAINKLENTVSEGGYVVALGSFHGEVYIFLEENEKTKLTLIKQSSHSRPIHLWGKGNVQRWYSENINLHRSVYSYENILENNVLGTFRGSSSLRTKFFGKEQLKKAFEQSDLRKIVDTAVSEYNEENKNY